MSEVVHTHAYCLHCDAVWTLDRPLVRESDGGLWSPEDESERFGLECPECGASFLDVWPCVDAAEAVAHRECALGTGQGEQ